MPVIMEEFCIRKCINRGCLTSLEEERVRTSILSVVVATLIVFAASGSRVCRAQTPSYQGVWTGMTMSSSSLGSAAIEADIVQSAGNLSGTARITQGSNSYTGTVKG